MLNIKNLNAFETFIKMLAGRVGQLINLSALSNDVGVSSQTLSQWLSVLENSFIIYRLPCYFENFGKRLVKSQKLYFTEPGLAAWLLGINSPEQIRRDPLYGGLFENMVVIEALKHRLNAGEMPELYFLRDSQGLEADLLFRKNHDSFTIMEIKGGSTWNLDFGKNLLKLRKLSPKFDRCLVIYSGELTPEVDGVEFLNYKDTAAAIQM